MRRFAQLRVVGWKLVDIGRAGRVASARCCAKGTTGSRGCHQLPCGLQRDACAHHDESDTSGGSMCRIATFRLVGWLSLLLPRDGSRDTTRHGGERRRRDPRVASTPRVAARPRDLR